MERACFSTVSKFPIRETLFPVSVFVFKMQFILTLHDREHLWALAKILRARASEHLSNFCEQFKQRPNFDTQISTIRYPLYYIYKHVLELYIQKSYAVFRKQACISSFRFSNQQKYKARPSPFLTNDRRNAKLFHLFYLLQHSHKFAFILPLCGVDLSDFPKNKAAREKLQQLL